MNCIIVHGGNVEKDKDYNKHWIPWIKKRLEEKNIKVDTPLMPVDSHATYEDWKKIFRILQVNNDSILVGHSRGGAFLVRWLGETRKKVKKLILVAPCKIATVDYKKTFYDFEINPELKNLVEEIILFYSNNDEEDILESIKNYHEVIGGKLIELKDKGHFIGKEMETEGFPELLEEVLK